MYGSLTIRSNTLTLVDQLYGVVLYMDLFVIEFLLNDLYIHYKLYEPVNNIFKTFFLCLTNGLNCIFFYLEVIL